MLLFDFYFRRKINHLFPNSITFGVKICKPSAAGACLKSRPRSVRAENVIQALGGCKVAFLLFHRCGFFVAADLANPQPMGIRNFSSVMRSLPM